MSGIVARGQRLLFELAAVVLRHPGAKWRALDLKYKEQADLPAIARRYGIAEKTLADQMQRGFDNPAYRFDRDRAFYDYIHSQRSILRGSSWLDVGADTGTVNVYLSEMLDSKSFQLIDINIAPKTNFPVLKFDGKHLSYDTGSFDLIFFTYVLHHAADNAITLLEDAHRIARRHVIVLEDPKETEDDYRWAYKHDRSGTFRGRLEWLKLFDLLKYDVIHEAALGSQIHSRHLYILTPRETAIESP